MPASRESEHPGSGAALTHWLKPGHRWLKRSLLAFLAWWAAATLTTLVFPTVADYLPISLLWIANALAYGAVLTLGWRLIPAFTLAALTWNIARGDPLADILIGTGTFLGVMLFILAFSRLLNRQVRHDQARRLLRVPIIALASATVFTSLGVWQFTDRLPDSALTMGLWLSEATSVLLFTPLVQQVLTQGFPHPIQNRHFRPVTGVIAAWTLSAFLVLAALLLTRHANGLAQSWLPYAALTIPILAVYLLPTSVTRFAVAAFILVWVAVHYQVFDMGSGLVNVQALLNGQMIIFTATLIAFLAIESVRSLERANRRLQAARLRDGLTNLHNDLGLLRRLRERVVHPNHPQQALIGVQVPDIDDLYTLVGQEGAVGLEQRIGDILKGTSKESEALAARLQPGLFGMLVPNAKADPETAPATARSLHSALRTAEQEGQLPTARLGVRVALIDQVGRDDLPHLTPALLMACKHAGAEGQDGFYRHSGQPVELIEDHRVTLAWARRLREALACNTDEGGFVLFAQPIVDPKRRDNHRFEVLLRWQEPDGCIQSPARFMGIAEDFGLMPRVDRWVLTHALAQVTTHPARDNVTAVAINLSGESLAADWLPETVASLLQRHDWPAHRLCLEITETMIIEDAQAAYRNVQALHALGVKLAIDDFGTGRATFAYLQEYPVDELKIDGRFIRNVTESRFDQEVVRSTRALGDHLGSKLVAEFVETDEQIELLQELGVHYLQGFGLARPMPLEECLAELQGTGAETSRTTNQPAS